MASFSPIAFVRSVCTPAFVYFLVASLILFMNFLHTFGGRNKDYCFGHYSCTTPNTVMFIVQVIVIFFWTWILDQLCNTISPIVSWFLVLIPILTMLIMIGSVFL